jgi:hypothetical protein
VTAPVISIFDLRDARNGRVDNRTEMERRIDEAFANGRRQGRIEGLYDGMRIDLESRGVEMPTTLQPRRLAAVQMGGWAS